MPQGSIILYALKAGCKPHVGSPTYQLIKTPTRIVYVRAQFVQDDLCVALDIGYANARPDEIVLNTSPA